MEKNVTPKATLGGTGVAPQVHPPPGWNPILLHQCHTPPSMSYTQPNMMKRKVSLVPIQKFTPQAVGPAAKF